jgi:TonB family protein
MFIKDSKNISSLLSVAIHLFLILIFMIWNINPSFAEDEFVTVGFGTIGKTSSSGSLVKKQQPSKEKEVKKEKKEEPKKEEKKVELPKVVNEDDDNIITAAKKKEKKEEVKPAVKPLVKAEDEEKGRENEGEGEGSFGFEIDFGGKGKRKIYSYSLPAYPQGVSKEIDVKLRFSILPDGSVGRVFPLLKADARLESAAISSIKKWRFEPLPNGQQQIEQVAVIVFPYRLQ